MNEPERATSAPIIVWRFTDGKPGHENQSLGLIEAIGRTRDVEQHDIDGRGGVWRRLLLKGANAVRLPKPDVVIGAGHGTHLAVLAAKWRTGAKALILMKPTLPVWLFDLCIVPEHDGVRLRENVISVRGVLNRVRPSSDHDPKLGLILIGGPSKHAGWDDDSIIGQVVKIASDSPGVRWELTTSRRTPDTFLVNLKRCDFVNVTMTPCEETDRLWVPDRMARAGWIWVTEDSVSMVYEGLTSGAAVGLIDVPMNRSSRVAVGLRALVDDGMVVRCSDVESCADLKRSAASFNEAERCAREVMRRWFA